MVDIVDMYRLEKDRSANRQTAIQSTKLASIGELAAGIGHEINNPLAIAKGNIERLREKISILDNGDIAYKNLQKWVDTTAFSLERIRTIVDCLRIYSRTDDESRDVVDIHQEIASSVSMVQEMYLQDEIALELHCNAHKFHVLGNVGKFYQIIMNLLANAKDAMEESKHKVIAIVTKNQGDQLLVEVSDSGPGIPVKFHNKVFDSFFTTKEVGKGTGLGLGIVQKIVTEMEGTIRLDPDAKDGATFIITLPTLNLQGEVHHISSNKVSSPAVAPTKEVERPCHLKGRKALIVDDEPDLREILQDILEEVGLLVEQAESGEQALVLLEKDSFDIVYTDLKMPGMGGEALIMHAKILGHTSSKYVVITGGVIANEDDSNKDGIEMADAIIQKPFTQEDILKITCNLLER